MKLVLAPSLGLVLVSALRRGSHVMRSDDLQPLNDTTASGCMCEKQASCNPSAAQHHRCDWCSVPRGCGSYTITRGHYDFCEYKPEDSFTSLSADAKQQKLWRRIIADKRVQPQLSLPATLAEVLKVSMITTFDNSMEVFNAGRQKVIHQQGVVLQFDLEVDSASPYTGILMPGLRRGLMRLGSAFPADIDNFPGIGIKFLRSGRHSANTVALRHSGLLIGNKKHFFEEPLSNHVEPGNAFDMLQKFGQATGCRSMTGLSDFGTYAQDGTQVSTVNFPYEIRFDAPNRSQFPLDMKTKDMKAELLRVLSTIPTGTHLYNMYAKASPHAHWVQLGRIVTRSAPTTSWFGDTELFFRHQRMEEDFKLRPAWTRPAQASIGQCDGSLDSRGHLRPLSDWQCPGVEGIVPPV